MITMKNMEGTFGIFDLFLHGGAVFRLGGVSDSDDEFILGFDFRGFLACTAFCGAGGPSVPSSRWLRLASSSITLSSFFFFFFFFFLTSRIFFKFQTNFSTQTEKEEKVKKKLSRAPRACMIPC